VLLAAAAAPALGAAAAGPGPDWTTYGAGAGRAGAAQATPASLTRAFVLPARGRITAQVLEAGGTFYAATTAGEVVAFTADGYVRWRADVGQLAQSCAQLDGYGVLGTGVVDAAAGTLYVADAFGKLHALDLGSGAERPGWPVRVFADFRRELVWGALTLADGAVYVPTASYCDDPSVGGVYRVDVASRQVDAWISVPPSEGGGGGVWGWGGTAFSAADDALYAVTANALEGGTNTGDDFTESAGYGEHLVRLAPDLTVEAASHPADIASRDDLDFVGSPVVLDRPGCGELVAAADKNAIVYGWRTSDVGAGPAWELPLEPFDASDPFLSQLAWSSALSSLYAVTGTELVRIAVAPDCSARVVWRAPLGTRTENGSPTVAGNVVWFAVNGSPALLGYDARSGKRLFQAPLGGTTLEAPTVADGRLVVGTLTGLVEGFAFAAAAPAAPQRDAPTSWADARHGWQSRPDGVYSTDDGGRSWRLVHAGPALAVLRLSRSAGLISVGSEPGRCMCATRRLWTSDGGATWRETTSVADAFAAGGGHVYFWSGGRLSVLAPLARRTSSTRLASTTVASFADGSIVDVQPIPGGVAALVSSRVHGQGWDTAPRVVLVRGTTAETSTLPQQRGRLLAQRLAVAWPKLTVTATDFVPTPARAAVWTSADGGASWGAG